MEPATTTASPQSETLPGSVPPGKRAWVILGVCLWGFLFSSFYRVSVTVISPQLAGELGLDASQLSVISAAFFYVFAMSQLPLGVVLDRWGSRRVMTFLSGLAVAGSLLFSLSYSASWLVVARAFIGLGMGCNMIGTMVLIGSWFPPRQFATLTGIIVGVGTAGQLLAASPLVLLSQAVGWRGAFVLVAGINALQGLILWLVVRDHPPGASPPPAPESRNPLRGWGQLLRRPFFWVISLSTFFRYGCISALQGLWAGPFLVYGLGLSALEAGNALLFIPMGYMIGLPLCGRLSDQVLGSRKWVVLPALVISALLTLALGAMQGAPIWLLDALFFALGAASSPGQIMYPHVKELLPGHLTARALTGVNLFTMLGAAGVMQMAGLLVEGEPTTMSGIAGYWPVWLFMAVSLLASATAYLFIPDSRVVAKK